MISLPLSLLMSLLLKPIESQTPRRSPSSIDRQIHWNLSAVLFFFGKGFHYDNNVHRAMDSFFFPRPPQFAIGTCHEDK